MRIIFEFTMLSSVSRNLYAVILALFLLTGCGPSNQELAQQRVETARALIAEQRYEAALQQIDSLNMLYPKQVAQRKAGKALKDSVHYLQALRSRAYADSLLQDLLPKVDDALKAFRYDKDERYQDKGQYVYRTLQTGWNTQRCFLQASVSDDRKTVLKSFYYGARPLSQESVLLQSSTESVEIRGSNHAFEVEGWHEIMTVKEDKALEVLNFISTHIDDKIRVTAQGKNKAAYILTDNEKTALQETYRLGILMRDIARLEANIHSAEVIIHHYESTL